MKEKTVKKLRFDVQPLETVEEKPPVPPEQKRKNRLSNLGRTLLQQSKRNNGGVAQNQAQRQISSQENKTAAHQESNKPLQKVKRHTSPDMKPKTAKPAANQNAKSTKERTPEPKRFLPPVTKPPEQTVEKPSPTKSPAFKKSVVAALVRKRPKSRNDEMNGRKDVSRSKGWDFLMQRPNLNRQASYDDKIPGMPTEEDALSLPFGGSRRLSDSNLMAANPATNIIYLINQARKKRLKESINNEIAAVHDRVRKALEHADIYEEDSDNKEEQDGASKTGFDTRSMREIMKFRNELIYKLREHIEDCHKRMVLMTDVNKWIQVQQKELEEDLVSEEELDEEGIQLHVSHKKIMYTLEGLSDCTARVSEVGHKLIEVASHIISASNKGKVEKIHIIDEKTMLSNRAKWDQAIASILTVFDDAQKWVKAAPIKAGLRNGKKQYQVILIAVERRLSELAQMSKLAEDLQNKLMMSKEMINAYCKEAEESKKLVDKLGKELKAMQLELSHSMETNKKLSGQLEKMEGQVREMKAELSKPPPPPPRPPTPPTPPPPPPPPQESESAKLLMEKTKEQVTILQHEIHEYRMLVKNLSDRIDELEELLEKEQKRVQFLKESLETRTAQVVQQRPPEPRVEIPSEPAPPPEIASDSSSSYYKTLLSGMKKDFMVEVDKLKEHLKKEQNRNDASIRRLEQGHKDQIQVILKDCMRVLRAIVHFRDQVAIALEKEGFSDSARQLQQLPKLSQENVGQDPKDVLLYMAGNAVDYLHSMEVVMNHTMLAMKVQQKSGGVGIGNNPPVSQAQVFRQMEERMEEIRQPSTIRQAVKSPVKRVKSRSRRKDKQSIKKLQAMVSQFENKYMGLLDRYKLVWKAYTEQKRDMDQLHSEFDQTIRRKVKEKETMVVSAFQTELKERRAQNEQQLQMSIADQRKNLQLLDRALDENKISRELHQMATNLLHQAMDIPRKRFRYMIERYIAHRAVKDAEAKVTTVLREERMSSGQRSEMMLYMDQMQTKLQQGLSVHHLNMERLENERRNIFKEIWTLFNEVLLDTGVLLIQPVFINTRQVTPQRRPRTKSRHKKQKVKVIIHRKQFDIPTGLVGSNIPLAYKMEKGMWKNETPAEVSPQPAVTTPLLLDMDINRRRLLAKRKLQMGPRRVYPISESRSYTICNEMSVDFISTTVKPPSCQLTECPPALAVK